jgi:hypothetical protein
MSYSNNNDQWGSSFGNNSPASPGFQATPGAVPVIHETQTARANQPNPGTTTFRL